MRFFPLLLLAASVSNAEAFALSKRPSSARPQMMLAARPNEKHIDRRSFGESVTFAGVSAFLPAAASAAAAYQPQYDDVRQIYGLGASLDALAAKIADDTANRRRTVDGLHSFNKDPGYYPSNARNYIGKVVRQNADGDPRPGYIREAVELISSCEGLIEGGGEGFAAGKEADGESIRRIRRAQALIARFLAESGVEDDKVAAFVAAHP